MFSRRREMATRNIFRHFFRAFFFIFVLPIRNHTVFLVQLEINLHLWFFLFSVWKPHSFKLIPNLTYKNKYFGQNPWSYKMFFCYVNWTKCHSLRWYGTLKYGGFHEKFNFLKIQDLRPLNTCQKHFEMILPNFPLDECGI